MLVTPPTFSAWAHGTWLALTLQPAPSCDIAGVVVGQDGACSWQVGCLDLAAEGDSLRQFAQGDVVPAAGKRQSLSREGSLFLTFEGLRSPCHHAGALS